MDGLTGPIPERVVSDLQELRLRLAALEAADLPGAFADALGDELAEIQIQLRRLELDREQVVEALDRVLHNGGSSHAPDERPADGPA